MTTRTVTSSWLSSLSYIPMSAAYRAQYPGKGFIRVALSSGRTYSYLAPTWCFGLLLAHRSTGRAYNLLVRGQCERVAS